MLFLSIWKLFSFLRYLHFSPDFLGFARKRLDKKAKENFKIYDVTNWNANNHKEHIARYLKK